MKTIREIKNDIEIVHYKINELYNLRLNFEAVKRLFPLRYQDALLAWIIRFQELNNELNQRTKKRKP